MDAHFPLCYSEKVVASVATNLFNARSQVIEQLNKQTNKQRTNSIYCKNKLEEKIEF